MRSLRRQKRLSPISCDSSLVVVGARELTGPILYANHLFKDGKISLVDFCQVKISTTGVPVKNSSEKLRGVLENSRHSD